MNRLVLFGLAMILSACGGASAPQVGYEGSSRSSGLAELVLDVGPAGSFDACQAKYPAIVGDLMFYSARAGNCAPGSIGLAVRNGRDWEKEGRVRGLASQADHPTVLFENGRYRMWYTRGTNYQNAVGYAESSDGRTWVDSSRVLPGFHPAIVRHGTELHLFVNRPAANPAVLSLWETVSTDDGATWAPLEQVQRPQGSGYIYNAFALSDGGEIRLWYSWLSGSQSCVFEMGNPEAVVCNGFDGVSDLYAAFAPFVDGDDIYYSASAQRTRGYVVMRVR